VKKRKLCEKNKNNCLKCKQQQKDALKSQHGLPLQMKFYLMENKIPEEDTTKLHG
jgi:hypothetical protein